MWQIRSDKADCDEMMGMHCIIELLSKYQEIFDKMGRNNSLQILLLKGCVFAFVEPSIRKWVDAFENGQL